MNGHSVPPHILLYPKSTGVDVIAILPMEDYLAGVVPSEMPSSWPKEALKAQAIAARSFAYNRILQRTDREFDVESDILDQEYNPSTVSPRLQHIVSQTRELVLLNESDQILEALYHADCGGMTENAGSVWGGRAAATSHPDCPHPSRHWKVDLDRHSLVDQIINYFGLGPTTQLNSLQAVGRDSAGRVKEVRVDLRAGPGGENSVHSLSSQEFRRMLGYRRIPSTNFRLTWLGPYLHLDGLGDGHGVGLCQRGARALAESGRTFEEILRFYYPGSRLIDVNRADLRSPHRVAVE
jgi:stage II sporulation protein D